jgi:hypothetical protein
MELKDRRIEKKEGKKERKVEDRKKEGWKRKDCKQERG